jgi:hypothetical protein
MSPISGLHRARLQKLRTRPIDHGVIDAGAVDGVDEQQAPPCRAVMRISHS